MAATKPLKHIKTNQSIERKMFMNTITIKQIFVSYIIAAAAGIFSFLLALNVRTIILATYIFFADGIPWAMAFVNAATVILLMIGWLIYVFSTHHYLEKKCEFVVDVYAKKAIKLVAPVMILYLLSEMLMRT